MSAIQKMHPTKGSATQGKGGAFFCHENGIFSFEEDATTLCTIGELHDKKTDTFSSDTNLEALAAGLASASRSISLSTKE